MATRSKLEATQGKTKYTKEKITMSDLVSDIFKGHATKEALENVASVLDAFLMKKAGLSLIAVYEIDLSKIKRSDANHVITIPFSVFPKSENLRFAGADGVLRIPYTVETWGDFRAACRRSCYPIDPSRWDASDNFTGRFMTRLLQVLAMMSATEKLTKDDMTTLALCGKWFISKNVPEVFNLDLKNKRMKSMPVQFFGFDTLTKQIPYI